MNTALDAAAQALVAGLTYQPQFRFAYHRPLSHAPLLLVVNGGHADATGAYVFIAMTVPCAWGRRDALIINSYIAVRDRGSVHGSLAQLLLDIWEALTRLEGHERMEHLHFDGTAVWEPHPNHALRGRWDPHGEVPEHVLAAIIEGART